jgi:hypothetical protein
LKIKKKLKVGKEENKKRIKSFNIVRGTINN